ncbi:MAG: MATE family efflux transporter [Puniceicoccales bacterium]|nr:MATE family efflux transporter [Puniceicoccales bacterium]
MDNQLTKYEPGSVRELWTVAWPLIISSGANMLMILADRIVVAKYSNVAFQSMAGTVNWWWTIYFTALNIALIADVFVGRLNGSKNYKKIGSAVWQMIWFAIALAPAMVAFAMWVAPHLLAENLRQLGLPYMRILLIATPIPVAAMGALGSFFTGRGKTKVILYVSIICNVINVCLDIVLVFGLGPFPELGIMGAGIATVSAQIIELLLFSAIVFCRKNGEIYGIFNFRFDRKLFLESLKIGLPNAIDCLIGGGLWSFVIQLAAINVSGKDLTILFMAQTCYTTAYFMIEGIGQGVGIITSNAYGAKNWDMIQKNMSSWRRLAAITGALSFGIMVAYPNPLISILRPTDIDISGNLLPQALFTMWIWLLADAHAFNLRMSLTAFGDTRFTMAISPLCFAIFCVIPSYIGLRFFHNILCIGTSGACAYSIFSAICFFRLKRLLLQMRHPRET